MPLQDEVDQDHVVKFINFLYKDRTNFSTVGRIGRGKSSARQAQYLLTKYVFTKIYNSWRELGKRELENRSAPLQHAMNETWESLIRTEMEPEVHGSGQPFVKQRWTDLAYY